MTDHSFNLNMLDNKSLNEHCGFIVRLMNNSFYPNQDYYEYASLFKTRDKECTPFYDCAVLIDELKKYNIEYNMIFKDFSDDFSKLDQDHFLFKHFELTHKTYVEMYFKLKTHLDTNPPDVHFIS